MVACRRILLLSRNAAMRSHSTYQELQLVDSLRPGTNYMLIQCICVYLHPAKGIATGSEQVHRAEVFDELIVMEIPSLFSISRENQ